MHSVQVRRSFVASCWPEFCGPGEHAARPGYEFDSRQRQVSGSSRNVDWTVETLSSAVAGYEPHARR